MRRQVIAVLALSLLVGCDEAPNNTELCRHVYDALCHRADACGALESLPECTAHYREACRTMLLHEGVLAPTAEEEQSCVDAIGVMDCETLGEPGDLPECDFLNPPPEETDGDGDVDSDSDADADGDADGDGGIAAVLSTPGDPQQRYVLGRGGRAGVPRG